MTDTTINIPVTATMTVDGVAVPVIGTAALDLNALQSALAALNVAPLDVTTVAALSPATAGTSYSASIASVLAVTGGVAPYTFAVSGLPAGLSYASGEISGTPTVAGNSNLQVSVKDSSGQSASAVLAFTVNAAATSTGSLPAPNLPAGPYSYAATPQVVFAGGVLNWPVDFTYGGLVHSIVDDPLGSGAKVLECSTPAGTGGWQPGYQNPPPPYVGTPVLGTTYNVFATKGYSYLNADVLVTEQNCTFLSAFLGASDSAIPGAVTVTMEKFGSQLTVGSWVRWKIPLGEGGYNLGGAPVLKFNVQENNPMPGNKFYFNNVFFD